MSYNPGNIAIIGASGAIGSAFTKCLRERYPNATLHPFSRTGDHPVDYSSEDSIAQAAALATKDQPLDLVITAIGILHDDKTMPEKSLKEISAAKFHHLFEVNTIIPALIAKHFLPKLNKTTTSRFAALSARVGSISDNHLGGWYAYRASKAALNMIIKNAAIEMRRSNKLAVVIGLHPGTVDSPLSKPFQQNVPGEKLFTPEFAAQNMLDVLENSTPEQSGRIFDWRGEEILP